MCSGVFVFLIVWGRMIVGQGDNIIKHKSLQVCGEKDNVLTVLIFGPLRVIRYD